jgi:pyruvate decarboxylase
MVSEHVDASRLKTPLDLTPPKDDVVEDHLVSQIIQAVLAAKNPMILADVFTSRFQCTPEVRELVEITQFPVCLPVFAKSQANLLSLSAQIWEREF